MRSAAGRRRCAASDSRPSSARLRRSSRQRNISSAAAGGGGRPVSFSRTSSASACAIGAGRGAERRRARLARQLLDERRREVLRHTGEDVAAQGLAAHVLDRVEDFPRAVTGGPEAGMQHRVVIRAAQRQVIGMATNTGRVGLGERPLHRRQAHRVRRLAGQARAERRRRVPWRRPAHAWPAPAHARRALRERAAPGAAGCSNDLHAGDRLRQFGGEGALVELGDRRPLEFVALVEERDAEREPDVAEDLARSRPRR